MKAGLLSFEGFERHERWSRLVWLVYSNLRPSNRMPQAELEAERALAEIKAKEAGKAAEVLFDQKQLAQAAAVAPTPAAHSILTSLTAGEDIASGRIFKKELLWVLQYPVRLACLRTFPQHLPGTNTL